MDQFSLTHSIIIPLWYYNVKTVEYIRDRK